MDEKSIKNAKSEERRKSGDKTESM